MERSILWSALIMGALGWLVALLLPPARGAVPRSALDRTSLWAAIALPIAGFLVTLPTGHPFAVGHGWGTGFLLGGAGALLTLTALHRIRQAPDHPILPTLGLLAGWFAALAIVAATELMLHDVLLDALLGIALGWISVALIVAFGKSEVNLSGSAALVSTLCATVGLAAYRGTDGFVHARWIAGMIGLFAAAPLALLLTSIPGTFYARIGLKLPLSSVFTRLAGRLVPTEEAAAWFASAAKVVIASVLLLLAAQLVSTRLVEQTSTFGSGSPVPYPVAVTGLGILMGLLAVWLNRESSVARHGAATVPYTNEPTYRGGDGLAFLATITGLMLAYQMLAGLGIACALLGMWLAIGVVSSAGRPEMRNLLCFGSVILLYRLFVTRFSDDLPSGGLSDNFALFGLAAGALLPGLAETAAKRVGAIVPAVTSAIVLLGATALIVMLWGAKCLIAIYFGLAIGLALSPAAPLAGLLALLPAAAMAQWTHISLPLAALSRTQKVHVLEVAAAVLLVALILRDYIPRIMDRSGRRGPESEATQK